MRGEKTPKYTAVKFNIKFAAFVYSPKVREGGQSIRLTLARYICVNWLPMMNLTKEIVISFEASSIVRCIMNR